VSVSITLFSLPLCLNHLISRFLFLFYLCVSITLSLAFSCFYLCLNHLITHFLLYLSLCISITLSLAFSSGFYAFLNHLISRFLLRFLCLSQSPYLCLLCVCLNRRIFICSSVF
jgi:hypothetical protein